VENTITLKGKAMNTKAQTQKTRTIPRASRRAARRPYSTFTLTGVRRFERTLFDRNRATYAPFRIY